MPQLTRIHEIVHHTRLERDEWHLVRAPCGRKYVLFETLAMGAATGSLKSGRKREIAVQAILVQNNELSDKLRAILNN